MRLAGFYTFGYLDGQSYVIFVPCLQSMTPAITVVIRAVS